MSQEIQETFQCRYCLIDSNSIDMINPCNCEGSLKYVHPQCLKAWIKHKHGEEESKDQGNLTNQSLYLIKCEICNFKIKYFTEFENNIVYSIVYTAKDIMFNIKNFSFFIFHMILIYLLYYRISFALYEGLSIIKKKIKTKLFMKLGSEIAIVFSFSCLVNDYIVKFYTGIYYEKRNEIFHFITKEIREKNYEKKQTDGKILLELEKQRISYTQCDGIR